MNENRILRSPHSDSIWKPLSHLCSLTAFEGVDVCPKGLAVELGDAIHHVIRTCAMQLMWYSDVDVLGISARYLHGAHVQVRRYLTD